MAVFKIEKQKNYTVMSNYHLQDRNLSYKAKGLLSFMLSLPEDWDYSLNGLVAVSKESKKAIRNILSELINKGYVVREQGRGEKGYYKYDYIIREIPVNVLEKDHPDTQKGDAVKGDTENGTQIKDKHVELNIRFLINPKKARLVESYIWNEILKEYKNNNIQLIKE